MDGVTILSVGEYVETFGENLITKRLNLIKPEYVIISNYNTSNYYFSFFGQDYAGLIYDYVRKNYSQEHEFGKKLMFIIYKRIWFIVGLKAQPTL